MAVGKARGQEHEYHRTLVRNYALECAQSISYDARRECGTISSCADAVSTAGGVQTKKTGPRMMKKVVWSRNRCRQVERVLSKETLHAKLECTDHKDNIVTCIEEPDLRKVWWDVSDDGYISNNLCAVLRRAGYRDELRWILPKP